MKSLHYKVKLKSSPTDVYSLIATDAGRARFWAEHTQEAGSSIHFKFPNKQETTGQLHKAVPDKYYQLTYFGSMVEFKLSELDGGTVLELINTEISAEEFNDMCAGWVSVLMALKAACDFGIDLRNHDKHYSWDQGFVDN